MANVRCPMCSKVNPSDVEVCINCGARLKPVRAQSNPADNEEPKPDWLSSLRSPDDSEKGINQNNLPKPSEPGRNSTGETQSESLPDWLSRIRERAREETIPEPALPDSEADSPDWMKDLRGGNEGPAVEPDNASEVQLPEEPESDWLARLPGGVQPESHLEAQPEQPTEDIPPIDDWLQQYPEQTGTASSEENENWISKLSAWQSGSQETGTLGNPPISNQSFEPAEGEEEKSQTESFGLTGFLSSLQENQPADNQPPDWHTPEPQFPAASSAENSVPDWLFEENEPPTQPETAPSSMAEPGLPAWMADSGYDATGESKPDIEPAASQVPASENEPEESLEAEGLPDWFTSYEEAQAPVGEQPSPTGAGTSTTPAGDLPEWLRAGAGFEPEEAVQPGEDSSTLEQSWQIDLSEPANTLSENTVFEDSSAKAEEPAGLSSIAGPPGFDFEMPSGEESQEIPEPARPVASEPFIDEDTPQWLREFSSQGAAESGLVPPLIGAEDQETMLAPVDEADQALSGGELPDWLSEDNQPVDTTLKPEQAAEPVSEELARADLPEWVKEMRPIESVIPGVVAPPEGSQQVEKAGPLAGLRGVLPADDLAARYRKPPVYSAKLRVTEKQRSQASLFESILTQETQPILIAPRRSKAPRLFARIVVAVLFLAVLFGLRFFPLGLAPAPLLTPPELLDMFEQIDRGGQSQAPVLLAVDFEPGRAGEMFFASSPVIEHLMEKNARIVILSTVPAGPALAERLLADTELVRQENSQQAYDLNSQTLNLGYLPGGTISLLEFAQIPSRAAPANLTGDYQIWQNSFLKDVTGMNGFSQVIVLTDSAETGRAWVEQVQPLMGGTPLFMVTSVQAAPMLMPYVQSKQIDGLVSGLLGGVIYSQWRQADTPASGYWELYQAGTLLAFGIMLVGGVISAGIAVIKRKNKDEA